MIKDNLLHTVRKTVAKYHMISQGESVVVAVSGGADSMALLHVLLQLKEEWNLSLIVAHVNHCLRGEESDRDQAFVEDICNQWNLPCRVAKEDMLAFSQASGRGVEEASRGFRYAFFQQTAPHPVEGKIATAHTADDNAETVLLNLVRGTGVTGLAGIPPTGRIIRPLMECSREMVEEYCERHKIPFVTDSTNLQDDYRRNQIRHHVIPALKQQNPSFLQAITRMTQANRRDSRFLLELGKELLDRSRRGDEYDAVLLQQAPEVPLTYAVKTWLRSMGLDESAYHLEKIKTMIRQGYGTCALAGDREAQVSGGVLRAVKGQNPTLDFSYGISLENRVYQLFEKSVSMTVSAKPPDYEEGAQNVLDGEAIGNRLVLRNRRPGDSITLPGRPHKTLKKLLNERKIPVWERNRLLILADEQGVLWIEGIGTDVRGAVTPKTKKFVSITITEGI